MATSEDIRLAVDRPEVGHLPRVYAERLANLLASHTSTAERVWFAVWNGWGGLALASQGGALLRRGGSAPRPWAYLSALLRGSRRQPPSPAPTFHLLGRDYYLFRGPLGAITTSFGTNPVWISANLWWSDDRTWCVATEIDFAWTYVGGSTQCVDSVLADSEIEALPTEVAHGITHDSDHINSSLRPKDLER